MVHREQEVAYKTIKPRMEKQEEKTIWTRDNTHEDRRKK